MSFALANTSGCLHTNVNGKDMVPGPYWRHFPSGSDTGTTGNDCASGCSNGEECAGSIYISSQKIEGGWTGASGAIIVFYQTNTTNKYSTYYGWDFHPGKGPMGYTSGASCIANDFWDISAQKWYGEYAWSRGSRTDGVNYQTTFNEKRFDVGDQWTAHSLHEDHQHIDVELDLQNYLVGVWGGHYQNNVATGYCYLQCFKSTKPITDPTWKPSGADSWVNMGAIHTTIIGAYPKIYIGKCSCHNNWYFVGTRTGASETSDWNIFYSLNTGSTWEKGIRFSKKPTEAGASTYTYVGYNFDYDPVADRTLLFLEGYPNFTSPTYNNPGYGKYWTDCHRMSGSVSGATDTTWRTNFYPPTGGFFATNIDPQNVTNTQVIVNNCPCAYSGMGKGGFDSTIPPEPDRNELEIYDRYDVSSYPSWLRLDPTTRVLYGVATYNLNYPVLNYGIANNLWLIWKTMGTTTDWKSSQIWTQTGVEDICMALASLDFVSGNNHDKYLFIPGLRRYVNYGSNNNMDSISLLLSGPAYSSASNVTLYKNNLECAKYHGCHKQASVSKDRRVISALFNSGNSDTGELVGSARRESWLTYWDNTMDAYCIRASGSFSTATTTATVNGRVVNGSGNVTLYYDTVDHGEDTTAWPHSKDCGPQYYHIDKGWFTVDLDSLSPNTTYLCKFYMSTISTW